LGAPAGKPDAISSERCAVHQLADRVVDTVLRHTAPHDFAERSLGPDGVAEREQRQADIGEGAQTGIFVFVELEGAPNVGNGLRRLAHVLQRDPDFVLASRFNVAITVAARVGQDLPQGRFG
jgi:hypothetical protein